MVAGVVGELNEMVDAVSIVPVGDEIVAGFAARERLEARLLEALAGFVATGGPDADGYRSAVGWLKAHVVLTDGEAKALAVRAQRLATWPTLAKLFYAGSLSAAQVAVIVSAVPRELVGVFADHDEELAPMLVGLGVGDTREAISEWVRLAQDALSPDPGDVIDPDQVTVDGFVHLSRFGPGDRGRLDGELGPDATMTIDAALTAATRPDETGEFRVPSQRRAEALVKVCEFYTAHVDCEHPRRPRTPQVVVTIDLADLYKATLRGLKIRTGDDLERFLGQRPLSGVEEGFLRDALAHATGRATTLDGHKLTPEAITTIFGAGTTLERLMLAEGRVLDHGRQVRLVTGPLRDAMLVRDAVCRFPSPTGERCDAPVAWIDGHHIDHWTNGGTTSIDNAVALCSTHHGVVHRNGWTLTTAPDGTITVTTPDGTRLVGKPPRATRPPRLPLHQEKDPGQVAERGQFSGRDHDDRFVPAGNGETHDDEIGASRTDDDGIDDDLGESFTCGFTQAGPPQRLTTRLPEPPTQDPAPTEARGTDEHDLAVEQVQPVTRQPERQVQAPSALLAAFAERRPQRNRRRTPDLLTTAEDGTPLAVYLTAA